MKIDKTYSENRAIVIDEEQLRYMDSFLRDHLPALKYEGNCVDNTVIGFEGLDELLSYENPNHRKLTSIQITGYRNDDCGKTSNIKLVIGRKWDDDTLSYSLHSENLANVTFLEAELRKRILELRPWYWPISHVSFSSIVTVLALLWVLSIGVRILIVESKGATIPDEGWNITPAGVILWILLFAVYSTASNLIDRFRKYAFPKVRIRIGRQIKKDEQRVQILYFIFVGLILTFILGVFNDWFWDKIH